MFRTLTFFISLLPRTMARPRGWKSCGSPAVKEINFSNFKNQKNPFMISQKNTKSQKRIKNKKPHEFAG